MQSRDLKQLVDDTADAAFAVDPTGTIVAWNRAAETLFGLKTEHVVGEPCEQIIRGSDETGPVCGQDCSVREAAHCRHPVGNFDIQVPTPDGPKWCNVSVLHADVANSSVPYSLHVVRAMDIRKRMEMLVRDFLLSTTQLPADKVKDLISSTRSSPAREVELTKREIEVLRLLAKGRTTESLAEQLHISRTTVNNHIQKILQKLNAHSRLEAIRRAEIAGLI